MYGCLLTLLVSGAGEATAQPSQRQAPQIHLAQVGAAQVKPLACPLAPVVPGDRAAAALVGREQPLDVGTGQAQVFEGVDAVGDVGWYCPAFGEKLLAFGVDLWLGAPGLVALAPVPAPVGAPGRRPCRACRRSAAPLLLVPHPRPSSPIDGYPSIRAASSDAGLADWDWHDLSEPRGYDTMAEQPARRTLAAWVYPRGSSGWRAR